MSPIVLPVWLRALIVVVACLAMGVLLDRWGFWLGQVEPLNWLGVLIMTALLTWVLTEQR